MALTNEILKANEALSGLDDKQLAAITTLSANDEAAVINTKIGEQHGLLEKDVFDISGVGKKDGEKSYMYMKRVLQNYKETSEGSEELKADIVAQKQKIKDLESKIESGKGNEAVAQKLRDTQENLKTLQEQYDTDKQSWTDKEEGFQNKIKNIHVDSVFAKAQSGLKFKASYPESVQKTLIKSAKEEILRDAKPDWIESEGDRILVFRNENGDILRNKSKGLNPYTANELLAEKLKDSIEVGGKPGAGTKPPSGKPDEVSLVDLSSAKTQVAADEIITSYLLQQGEIRGSGSFSEKQAEIRTKNEISKLPLR